MQAMLRLRSASALLSAPHSAVSSLFWLIKQKKLFTPKHAKCHKSLNSQNSLSPSLSVPPTTSPCSPATKLLVSPNPPIGRCFFPCKHFLLADTFMREACFYRLSLHQTRRKRSGNFSEKVCRTLFIISPVLLGLSTQFKNWYTVWRLLQHISRTKTHWVVLAHQSTSEGCTNITLTSQPQSRQSCSHLLWSLARTPGWEPLI